MAHKPEWFPQVNTNDAGILGITMNVVGYIRGSYDCMPERHALDIRALEWVVDHWDDSDSDCSWRKEGEKKFDETILDLVKQALEMDKKQAARIKKYKESGHFDRSIA